MAKEARTFLAMCLVLVIGVAWATSITLHKGYSFLQKTTESSLVTHPPQKKHVALKMQSNLPVPVNPASSRGPRVIGIDPALRQYHYQKGIASRREQGEENFPNCEALPPAERQSEVHVTWCQSADGCRGEFRIDRNGSPCSAHQAPPVRDSTTAEMVKDPARGPDAYRLRIVGESEIVLPVPLHQGKCVYRHRYHLMAPGKFHLEGELWYRNYKQYDEFTTEAIPMVRAPVFKRSERRGERGAIEGAQHHDAELNLYAYNDPVLGKMIRKGKFRASKNFVWDQFTLASRQVQGECNPDSSSSSSSKKEFLSQSAPVRCRGSDVVEGRWRNDPPGALAPELPPERAYTHFERSNPRALYAFVPVGCYWKGFSQEEAAECVRGKKVGFIGDSHNRVSFVHLLNLLARPQPPQDHGVKQMGTRRETLENGSIQMDFFNDVLMENIHTLLVRDRYDIIVAGLGSWAVGGQGKDAPVGTPSDFGRWSLAKYSRHVESVMSHFARLNAKKVIWIGIPAYPPNQRTFAKLKGEYRNNPRLELFNTVAYRIAKKYNISIVDAFGISLPMVHLSLDHNHFVTYVQDAILHSLLNVMC